ncbi:MAG TPA: MFS transporter [Rikenellaceae bacterium]|nr:MFS transporter [Rikenellaceae bacterium]HCQ72353.1 MFS transporter [Rikenellaceae bacterium]
MKKVVDMSKYSTTSVFISACAGMAFFGIAMLSLAPILGKLNSLVVGANSLPSTMSLGILLGTILFGPVVDRFGYKWLLVASSVLALAGLQGLANFREIEMLHASIFCLGLGGGILNGETNALVSDIYDDDKRGGRLGLLGAFYCVGALLWTLLNYFIVDYTMPLNAVSVVMAVFILFFMIIRFPSAKPTENLSVKKSLGLLKYPALLLFAIVLFFESGFEGAQGNFTVSYLCDKGEMSMSSATLAMTWFTIGMLVGRLPLGAILGKLGALGTLYSYLSAALAGVLLLLFGTGSVVSAYLSMILIGFGVGATYPVILNYIGGAFRELSGTAISIALFIALLGQYAFNKMTGAAFDAGHQIYLPILLAAAVASMMVLVPIAVKVSSRMKK